MLTKIVKNENTITVNYDDNKMTFSENEGEATETTVCWVESNTLLTKGFTLMNDNSNSNQNTIVENKIIDNCVVKYANGNLIEKNCEAAYGIFPYTHIYTSYQKTTANQESAFMELIKYKIEKKEKLFLKNTILL